MKILIIPEHFRKDQYFLKPLFENLCKKLGLSSHSRDVQVCQDPLLGSVNEALKPERLAKVVERYVKIDVFILCVDRDGETGRRDQLDRLEEKFGETFFAVNAWEELETWILAGFKVESLRKELRLPREKYSWRYIRAERDSKERYFEPLAEIRGLANTPDGGRRQLGVEAASQVKQIRQKCPEDFGVLAKRLEDIIKN